MDFIITVLLAGFAGWLANFLFKNMDLGPMVYFFVGIVGGTVISFIFKTFNIPFLGGHLGTFGFALIGSITIYLTITAITFFKKTEN
ncbi:hypothetical protein [Wenyingzhuangia sp. IMCC45574]